MSDTEGPQAPAGWYPDPDAPSRQRYWDGTRWTEHTAPGPGSARTVGAGGPPRARPVDDTGRGGPGAAPGTWLWQSIVATVLCCVPAGIVAIVYAAQARGAITAGDLALARDRAAKARTWTLVSVGVGLVAGVVWWLLVLTGAISPEDWTVLGQLAR